jgi:polysaccharide export outer membrane protein
MLTIYVKFYRIFIRNTGITAERIEKRYLLFHSPPVCFLLLLLVISSCTTTKSTTYFQDLQKDTTLSNIILSAPEPVIRKGDLLTITVASLSPENTLLYNAAPNMTGTTPGYLVDENGNIGFFKLGTLHVEGKTKKDLKQQLEASLAPYLREPVVTIGFQNRHITIMGAAGSQVMPITGDHLSLLDALATTGGINEKARPDNILVIRESDTAKIFKRLDLTDESIFSSPYYYLQPNDIVYVEPAKKEKQANITRVISYVTAGISFALLIIDRVIK